MSGIYIGCPCSTISTIFVFQSPASQTAANNVYVYTSTQNGLTGPSGKKRQFNSDFERMQYLQGKYGVSSLPPR
jgi:hypothetical protein